jgi:NTE family protein
MATQAGSGRGRRKGGSTRAVDKAVEGGADGVADVAAASLPAGKSPRRHARPAGPRRINLALQGGGAHGAFTWGVLDRLLEEESIEIAAISGTSAGALNGAALKAGLCAGGRDGAREMLAWLWSQVSEVQDPRMIRWMAALWPGDSPVARMMDYFSPFEIAERFTRMFSPYDYGIFYSNPLERIVARFSPEHLVSDRGPALFVSATNVRTGRIRIFADGDLTDQAILASSCLPTLFQAVEIADPATGRTEAYWDGGYAGNPALFPLYAPALPRDILLVTINPLVRKVLPRSAEEIENRINEVSFNATLLSELRAINFVRRLIATGAVSATAMKDVLMHIVSDDRLMTALTAETKLMPTTGVIARLRDGGRRAAERFLARHGDSIGRESTVDLAALFG